MTNSCWRLICFMADA